MTVEIFIICVLATSYMVRVLLLDGGTQPFESTTHFVKGLDDGPGMTPVGLMDRIRRLFGVYRVVKDTENGITVWHTTVRSDLWRCPKCLSFWMSFLVSGPFTFFVIQDILLFPTVHLSIAYLSQLLVFVQLWFEGE